MDTGSHGGTYGGNPLTCAAGIATLEVIEPLLPHIKSHGDLALSMLTKGLKNHPNVGDIRGMGLMIGIEFVASQSCKTPAPEIVKKILKECLNKRVLFISCGTHQNVIRLMPPLTITNDELNHGIQTLIKVCLQL